MATSFALALPGSRRLVAAAAAVLLSAVAAAPFASAQTQPQAVPVPFTSAASGNGSPATVSAACTTGIVTTDGVAYGDGCAATQAVLSSPQGATVDKFGNIYVADYSHRLVRVVYNGGTALAAAITAANSNFTPTGHAAPGAITPAVGNIYTIAGTGLVTTAITANGSGAFPCANNAASATAGSDAFGDGCPGAGAVVGPRDVKLDNDGNLFITDYTDSRIRVLCVNCAANTLAAQLITLENPGVTPVNGSIYTVVGFSSGYRDQAIGYGSATAATVLVALLRSPTGAVVSPSDDVFIADNTNNAVRVLYNGGTAAKNILTAQGYTPVQGYVYTIAGDGCISAASGKTGSVSTANACLGTTAPGTTYPSTNTATDTPALGAVAAAAPTTASTGVATGVVWSVYLDPNGNVFYSDATNARVKVIYGGIAAPLTITAPQVGFTYSFAGQGTGTAGAANGVAPSGIALSATTGAQGVGGDAAGNIFFTDFVLGYFYETYAQTGITAIIGGNSAQTTLASGAFCNGSTTGPKSTDANYNGCPLTQAKIASPRGPVVSDNMGNLYFGDSVGYYVRRFSYGNAFPATPVGTASAAQPYAFTFLYAQTVTPAFTTRGVTGTVFADAGSDTCGAQAASSTCVENVTFTPNRPGLTPGALELTSGAAILGQTLLTGTGLGAGLNVDPTTSTTTGVGLMPNGIAVDGAGRVLVTDIGNQSSKNLYRYTNGTAFTVATAFTTPSGVAVDGLGNIFVADTTANTITEIPVTGTRFTFATGLNAPTGLATDGLGNLFVADTGNNRIVEYLPGATVPTVVAFTGLTAPTAVAVDAAGNLYAADSTHIVKLPAALNATTTPAQTTVATGSAFTGLAVDAAGNVLATTGATLVEYPASGAAATTLATGLVTTKALALDASGNAFVADTGKTGFLTFNRTAGAYTFPTGTTSTPIYLTSSGNAALTTPTYAQTDTLNFSVVPATTNGCSGALAPGTLCALTANFTPASTGTFTDTLTFASNFTNASPVTFTLTGTGAVQSTTTSLKITSPTLVYGNAQTLTATVAGATSAPSTGTVNFYNNTNTLVASGTVTNGLATASYVPAVGAYSITAVFVPSSGSFKTSTSAAGTFTVTPATLTVTANAASKTFGAANPPLTYSISGFVNNDTQASATTGQPMETTTATTTSPSGTYPITITQGTLAAANYTFTFVNGTLTVTGASAQTITFAALPNVTYGAAPITLTATASSNLPVSYTVTGPATVSGSTLTITGVGTVSVTASQTGNNTYAAATPVTQSFTVSKAALTVTANSLTRVYGSANPTLTYTVTGFVYSDTQATATTGAPTVTTTATASSNVGTYVITTGLGTLASTNYNINLVNGTLTVTPAPLTLTANSFTRGYGAANPTFTGTILGVVNGDAITESFSTTATATSAPGTYPIVPTATGANVGNYAITATNGTLTITAARPTITFSATPTTGFSGQTTFTLTATVTSTLGTPSGTVTFYSGTTSLGSVALASNAAIFTTTALPIGVDSLTAVYSGDTNYTTVTSTAVTVTVYAVFGATSSTTALAFQPNYQEAQAFLTVNPGGRTDTITFACQGLPAKITCAFNPSSLALSGLTTPQTVQLLVSNSNATASLDVARTITLAALPFAALLLFNLRRRRLPILFALALLTLGAATGLTGCGSSPTALNQNSGSYPFTVTVNSGSTVLQTINYTLTIP